MLPLRAALTMPPFWCGTIAPPVGTLEFELPPLEPQLAAPSMMPPDISAESANHSPRRLISTPRVRFAKPPAAARTVRTPEATTAAGARKLGRDGGGFGCQAPSRNCHSR